MNNDADQKPKWREWIIFGGDLEYPVISGPSIAYAENIKVIEAAPALAEIESLHVENIEYKKHLKLFEESLRLPFKQREDKLRSELRNERTMQSFGYKESKAEIESLRAENAELLRLGDLMNGINRNLGNHNSDISTKLSAATAQMEKMAQALIGLQLYEPEGPEAYDAEIALAQYEEFKKETK